jgi:hypothetical protein
MNVIYTFFKLLPFIAFNPAIGFLCDSPRGGIPVDIFIHTSFIGPPVLLLAKLIGNGYYLPISQIYYLLWYGSLIKMYWKLNNIKSLII